MEAAAAAPALLRTQRTPCSASSYHGPLSPLPRQQVGALTIRLMFNKDKNWTKALKHMLVDLKFVLKVRRGRGWCAQQFKGALLGEPSSGCLAG